MLLHLDSKHAHLIGHESWYVGISRARSDVRIFTDSVEQLPAYVRSSLQQESALEVARSIVQEPASPKLEHAIETPKRERSRWRGFEIGR